MKKMAIIITILWIVPLSAFATPVPDTGQTKCYVIACTEPGGPFYGQHRSLYYESTILYQT